MEEGITRPPATKCGPQVTVSTLQNQDPALNEAAIRLGVSLRETEDQLMRDMLVSTATFANCVGGADGRKNRVVAVIKSSLIDLELLAA